MKNQQELSDITRDDALRVAKAAMPHFGIRDDARIEFIKHRENAVFRVTDERGAYSVRVHRPGLRTDAQIEAEISLLALLDEQGVPVPHPRRTIESETFAHVRVDSDPRVFQVDSQDWVPDSAPLGDAGDAWNGEGFFEADAFHELGRLCGLFHNISQQHVPAGSLDRGAWDLEGLTGEYMLWGDPRRLADPAQQARITEILAGIATVLENYGVGPDVFGYIHADYSPENVLLSPAGMTLIDLDDFGAGWWLFDLATVLFWYHRHPQFETVRDALLAGYAVHRPEVDPASLELEALIVARGLTYLGWAADRIEDDDGQFIKDQLLEPVIALGDAFLDRQAQQQER